VTNKIIFLGTGGGRITTFLQARATGGIIFQILGNQIHLDPGPGAIVRARQFGLNPEKTDIVCLSHCHTDHIGDAMAIMEAMTEGGLEKKGTVISNKSCVFGGEGFNPIIHNYIKKSLRELYVLEKGGRVEAGGVDFIATRTKHDDPYGIGLKLKFNNKVISYVGDTEYFDGLSKEHSDADILILNVLRPNNEKWRGHLCTDEAVMLIEEIIPSAVIVSHFGMRMLRTSPTIQSREIQSKTGIRCICAKDGMSIDIESLILEGKQKKISSY